MSCSVLCSELNIALGYTHPHCYGVDLGRTVQKVRQKRLCAQMYCISTEMCGKIFLFKTCDLGTRDESIYFKLNEQVHLIGSWRDCDLGLRNSLFFLERVTDYFLRGYMGICLEVEDGILPREHPPHEANRSNFLQFTVGSGAYFPNRVPRDIGVAKFYRLKPCHYSHERWRRISLTKTEPGLCKAVVFKLNTCELLLYH